MPRDCYEELLAPLQEGDVADIENKDIEFDGKNMEAIVVLLNFLYKRFDRVSHVQQLLFERRREKTCLQGFRPGLTQIRLCSYRTKLKS